MSETASISSETPSEAPSTSASPKEEENTGESSQTPAEPKAGAKRPAKKQPAKGNSKKMTTACKRCLKFLPAHYYFILFYLCASILCFVYNWSVLID